MDKPEDKIRALAYDLWIEDGRQEGKADYYWWTAARRLAESGDPDMSKEDAEVERPPVVAGLTAH